MGIGDWVLGILGIGPNPQSPIPMKNMNYIIFYFKNFNIKK
jgi:hypothetical protein